MSAHEKSEVDLDDPKLTQFDIVREGARADGVEIVHYEPQFAAPGTKAERRIVRLVSGFFLMAGLMSTLFVLIYVWWPFNDWPSTGGWEYESGNSLMKGYTPLLGLTFGLALAGIGFGVLIWGKKLMPHEIAIQQRHNGGSDPRERKITGTTLQFIGAEFGLKRRPMLKFAAAAGLAPVGALAGVFAIGPLIKDPRTDNQYFTTGFNAEKYNGGKLVRLVREDYSPIRPEDVSVGGQITAFPGISHGVSNKHADSPVLLIHLRDKDAATLREKLPNYTVNKDGMYGNLVAYSKICTHAGCPASLYEQQSNHLLCPCHQSQFDITDNAKPIFGPATRRLPMLAITVDEEGYLVARNDFGGVSVGPAFWERPDQ